MQVEELEPGDLDRIREIDRSETARFVYVREGDELRRVEANLELPTWSEDELAGVKARLVVSASDTESAIRFYLAYGFRPAAEDDPQLSTETEPTDIQLTLELSPTGC